MKLLFFSSIHCHPCEVFKPIFAAVIDELELRADYIYREEDRKNNDFGKYFVTSIPTIVALNNEGKACWSHTGSMTRAEIRTKLIELKEIYE